ncbi:MAG: hypothetical protein L6R40_008005 [Gallowayella cf. fulva]|nr:MAG: hypothetical protein L6R40_008005 [Xanthomendoza cf. fulva]
MPKTKYNIKASKELKLEFELGCKDQWDAIVSCLQEWQASGASFHEYDWESKFHPHGYKMATKMLPNLKHKELKAEAKLFSSSFINRLHELHADGVRNSAPAIECKNYRLILLILALYPIRSILSPSSSPLIIFSPRPLSSERAIILKEFEVARKVLPPLTVNLTSAATGADLSSSEKLKDWVTNLVSQYTEIIDFTPTFFTQLDDFTHSADMQEMGLMGTNNHTSKIASPISRARRALHNRFGSLQVRVQNRARTTVTAPAKMQSLFTKLGTDLDTSETLTENFLLLHSTPTKADAEGEEANKQETAQKLFNAVRNLRTSTWLARYSVSKIQDSISDIATTTTRPSSSSSSSLVLSNALANINSTLHNWAVRAGQKDQWLYLGSEFERFVAAVQGGSGDWSVVHQTVM